MSVEENVYVSELFDEYSLLLTDNKREIFEMHFKLDLSLGEIAEIRGVSRQSVSDCIASVKTQLLSFEEKLHFLKKKKDILRFADTLSDNRAKEELEKILGEN